MKTMNKCSICKSSKVTWSLNGIHLCEKCNVKEIKKITEKLNDIEKEVASVTIDNYNAVLNKEKRVLNKLDRLIKKEKDKKGISRRSNIELKNENSVIFKKKEKIIKEKLIDPKSIKKELDKYVIGQEDAKITLSTAISIYLCSLRNEKIKKKNVLINGPSGSGKTLLINTLGKIIDIPVVEVDTSTITAAAYQGISVEDAILQALSTITPIDKFTGKAIVFLDEIDKKAVSDISDASTKSVQDELLKIIEGKKIGKRKLDTSNILFIAGGSFSDRYKKVMDPITNNLIELSFKDPTMSDDELIEYGFSPEFLGRFQLRTSTSKLNKDDYLKLLNNENSIIGEYKEIASAYNCELVFSKGFLEKLANSIAQDNITGVRGLEKIISSLLDKKLFYNIYSFINKKVIIDVNGDIILK